MTQPSCLVSSVTLPPAIAQHLCDVAGVLACWLPAQQPLVEAALVYLLAGGTIRRRQRCRCRRTFCIHDAARLLLGSSKAGS
jgi:hypothetical protein